METISVYNSRMEEQKTLIQRVGTQLWVMGMFSMYILDRIVSWLGVRARIAATESDLFLGAALFLVGFFGFESGRFCDGNSADYLSCTRPATYYFYDAPHTILIVLGVFLILVWFVRNRR